MQSFWSLVLGCWLSSLASSGCGRLGYESAQQDPLRLVDSGSVGAPSPSVAGPDLGGPSSVVDSEDSSPDAAAPSPGASDGGSPAPNPIDGSAAAPGTCPDGAILCDSFDTDLSLWMADHNQGTASLDESLARSGARSVRLVAPERRTHARLRGALDPPLTGGRLFVRFFAYVRAETVVEDWNVIFEWSRDGNKVSVDLISTQLQLQVSGSNAEQGPVYPRDEWFCVLLDATIADQGSATLYMNGELAVHIDGDTLPGTSIDELWISSHAPQRQASPAEVHIDEFTATTTPLACP